MRHFLQEYYSDISIGIRECKAGISEYVGDEIVLSWNYRDGLQNSNVIRCFFIMKNVIQGLKEKYIKKYGVYPQFKAGVHGGPVIVTWVGEIKKEIIYIGDVMNTTARIQEQCNKLGEEFLISETLLNMLEKDSKYRTRFVEELLLRGKENKVRLFAVSENG